jgi:hypothetical protein
LGRGKNDIRQKIETRRQQTIKKLKEHQSLIQEMKQIQERDKRDARVFTIARGSHRKE